MPDPLGSEAVARARRRALDESGPWPSLIVPGAAFSDLLRLDGPARIDGTVEGEIIATDRVWIGATGRVRARLEAREVVVEGELAGEIRAAGRVDLRSTARVHATLRTHRLVLAEGAVFEGSCHTLPSASEAAPAAPPAPISGPRTP